MNITLKKYINGKSIAIYLFATFFCGVNHVTIGQTISNQLDSIHKLDINVNHKIGLYYKLLETYEKEKAYTQLGSDAHQIAKWLHKQPKKKKKLLIFCIKLLMHALKQSHLIRSFYEVVITI